MAAPRKSAAATAPQDARKAEVEGYATVEQCGVELTIPLGDNVPLEVMEVIGAEPADGPQNQTEEWLGDIAVTKALIGPEQWETFKAARPTLRDYRELSAKILGLTGN